MAGNPVFRKFEKDVRQGQYAGFVRGPQGKYGGYPQPGGFYPQPGFQPGGYPPAGMGMPAPQPVSAPMTMRDVISKSLILFAIVFVFAGASWTATTGLGEAGLGIGGLLWSGSFAVTLVLGLVIAFKKKISVPLILLYSVAEGVLLGALSAFFNVAYPGIVVQAIAATLCVFGGVLIGYRAGIIRVTSRSARVFLFLLIGYALFSLVNLALLLLGVTSGFGIGGSGPIGIGISIFAVLLASYSLAVDFDSIEDGIRAGAPEKTSWLMAYGLMVSLVWLYLEILRLLAKLRE